MLPAFLPLIFGGRSFSTAELDLIREVPSGFAALGITEISRRVCELLEWKRPNGGLKNPECRQLLERLAGQGLPGWPGRLGLGAPGRRQIRRTAIRGRRSAVRLGQTEGRGRMDRHHQAHPRAVKDLYVYPLCGNVQQRWQRAVAPVWQEPAEQASRP